MSADLAFLLGNCSGILLTIILAKWLCDEYQITDFNNYEGEN